MNPTLKQYLDEQRVGALALLLADGSSHSAAMHFSYNEEPFQLYFSTDKTSRKGSLVSSTPTKGSFVLGFSEDEWKTFQVDGEIETVTDPDKITKIKEIHYSKNPGSKKFETNPNTIFMVMTPTWFRYTDFRKDPIEKIEV